MTDIEKTVLEMVSHLLSKHPHLAPVIESFLVLADEQINEVDFYKVISPRDLGLDENVVYRGSGSGNKYLKKLFNDMYITKDDAILDIGCAKGSAIRCMLNFPFSKVDGIEISPTLSEIAIANFVKLKKNNVKIFNVNATSFTNYSDYNFFYLYNPFPDDIMMSVLEQMKRQIDKDREILIIYNNPQCFDVLEDYGYIEMRVYPDQWGNGISIYSNRPFASRLKRNNPGT